MKASDSLKLNEWVQTKKQWIALERPSQKQIAEQSAADLGFKVSVSSLRDILKHNGISTRGTSKHQAQVDSLKQEIEQLTRVLVKVVTASTVPDWLRRELESEDLTEEIKEVLKKYSTTTC